MGIDPASLALISGAISAVTSFAGVIQASAAASAQEDAATANFNLRQEEAERQQREAQEIAQTEKSDIIRQADFELGALQAAAGEIGATDIGFSRLAGEIGFVEGVDLSRISRNTDRRLDALQANKRVASQDFTNTVTAAFNQQSSAISSAVLGFAGSALQIGSDFSAKKGALERAERKTG